MLPFWIVSHNYIVTLWYCDDALVYTSCHQQTLSYIMNSFYILYIHKFLHV
jgi:hypothetical protein